MDAQAVKKLEKELDHVFKDKEVMTHALTHSSVGGDKSYERLEFLGDRVLGLIIAELIYERFPNESEGDLAKRLAALAQGELLALIAADMGLGAYIQLSDAEAFAGGAKNQNILADAFEALLGALYIDGGLKKCRALIERLWDKEFHEMKTPPQHPKTAVQEWAQGEGLPLPVYKIVKQHGPDHAPKFDIELTVQGHKPVTAQGHSRQEAEKLAAREFMSRLPKETK